MNNAEDRIDLRRVAQMALAEDECATPIEECRSKNGPACCRVHCVSYFDRLRDSVSFEDAAEGLRRKFGIDCQERADALNVIGDKNILNYLGNGSRTISKADFKDSVRALWIVAADLIERFPRIKIPALTYVGAEPISPIEGGAGSPDRLATEITFVSFNVNKKFPSFSGNAYGHNDARLPYDIIRHELGHSISTEPIIEGWRKVLISQVRRLGGIEPLRDEMRRLISRYSVDSPTWLHDSFAEAFAKFTSYDYRGDLPTWANKFLLENLKGE